LELSVLGKEAPDTALGAGGKDQRFPT
jgi:hypothetical protein